MCIIYSGSVEMACFTKRINCAFKVVLWIFGTAIFSFTEHTCVLNVSQVIFTNAWFYDTMLVNFCARFHVNHWIKNVLHGASLQSILLILYIWFYVCMYVYDLITILNLHVVNNWITLVELLLPLLKST